MSLEFEISQSGGPPAGIYRAKFKDVESLEKWLQDRTVAPAEG